MQFTWQIPTKIIMEHRAVRNHADQLRSLGKNAYILCTPSGRKNGALDDAQAACEEAGIRYKAGFDVEANPSLQALKRICADAQDGQYDFIIGIGGGSALDSAKAVAILLANPHMQAEEIFSLKYEHEPLPLAAIPTTCGTGSEVTAVSVINYGKTKQSVITPAIFPKVAFLDASYLSSLPVRVLKDTVVDALCHATEGYLSCDYPTSDFLACEFFKCLGECKEALLTEHCTNAELEKLLYASTIAGLVIAITGTVAVHTMSYPLTVQHGYTHGRACGVLLGGYMRLCSSARAEKIATMMNLLHEKNLDTFCELMRILLGQNDSFTDREIVNFTETSFAKAITKKNPVQMDREMVEQLYRESLV